MGRTNPTFRNLLEAVKGRWGGYRRALRRRDQPHFDRLFEHADAHADAAGYLNADDPMTPILVSMLLEHEKRTAELEARVDALEGAVEGDADTADAVEDDTDEAGDSATGDSAAGGEHEADAVEDGRETDAVARG